MVLKGLIKNLFLFLFTVFLFSCNAPRDNPLDPYSSKSDLAQIVGTVQTFSGPRSGIPDVSVFWIPGNIVVKTDSAGQFEINNIKPNDGLLIFQKNGYTSDSIMIHWTNSKKITTPVVNLNKIPKLDSYSIYSEVTNQTGLTSLVLTQIANLSFKVKISDSDNDIDSVFVKNEMLDFTGGLVLQGKVYQASFSTSELNVTDLEEIVGYNFDVYVIDNSKRSYLVGSNKIVRVIKNGPDPVYPINDTTLSIPFTLNWSQFNAGYPYNYKVEIYNAANTEPFYSQDNIPSAQTSVNVDTTAIISGDYLWVVYIVDKFSDSYKSQPGKFHIK
jgi:hypothetical protein